MKILRIADVPNNRTAGVSRALYGTTDILRQWQHDVTLLLADTISVSGPEQSRRFSVPWFIARELQKRAQQGERYDVVEVHEPLGAPLCWQRRYTRASHIPPIVAYSHGLEERGWKAELDYKRKVGTPVTLKNRFSPLSVVLQARYTLRHADHVVVCNWEDQRYLVQNGIPSERISVLRNGVEEAFLGGTREAVTGREKRILFLATWIARKGIRELASAAEAVLPEFPEAQLTVAGCGVAREQVLESFAPTVRKQVTVVPKVVGNDALIDLYAQHGIFVLPSFYEGLPLAMVEAASQGLAIVTTQVCGMADFLKPEENGLGVPVGDTAALSAALRRLLSDPALVQQLGRGARDTVLREHTWKQGAQLMLEAYEKATGQSAENKPYRFSAGDERITNRQRVP